MTYLTWWVHIQLILTLKHFWFIYFFQIRPTILSFLVSSRLKTQIIRFIKRSKNRSVHLYWRWIFVEVVFTKAVVTGTDRVDLIWLFFDWGSRVESIRLTSRFKRGLLADNEILVKDRLFDFEFWHLIIMGSWWKTINYLYNWRILMRKITEIHLINYIINFIFLHSKIFKLV